MEETFRHIVRYQHEGKPLVIGYIADQEPNWRNIHLWTHFLNHETMQYMCQKMTDMKEPFMTALFTPYLSFGVDLLNTPAEETWAVNYLNGICQYVKYDYVLQFDGQQTKAVCTLDDKLITEGRVEGHHPAIFGTHD